MRLISIVGVFNMFRDTSISSTACIIWLLLILRIARRISIACFVFLTIRPIAAMNNI